MVKRYLDEYDWMRNWSSSIFHSFDLEENNWGGAKLDNFQKEIINFIFGIMTGIAGTVAYNKVHFMYEKWKRRKVKRELHTHNILEFCDRKKLIPIVSFGDSHAIEIEPLLKNGIYLLRADINLERKPPINIDRIFVMALLQYTPYVDWSYYAECGYRLKLKIRGNIKGVQLEVKNRSNQKLIDEYIGITSSFELWEFPLDLEPSRWKEVKEICFTVFDESEYILNVRGYFEIINLVLDR